jgi:hypothetical protein
MHKGPDIEDREDVQVVGKRLVTKINVEISCLRSWREYYMLAAGSRALHEIISSKIGFDGRRKSSERDSLVKFGYLKSFAMTLLKRQLKITSLQLSKRILDRHPHSMSQKVARVKPSLTLTY